MSKLDATIGVRNPRTGKIDRPLDAPSRDELSSLVSRLRSGQRHWHALGPVRRGELMLKWREAIIEQQSEIVEALVEDTGRRTESILEVMVTLAGMERWAKQAPDLLDETYEQTTSVPGVLVVPSYRPYELVGVISPWNFPLLLAMIDAIPALMAGSAILVKPSEIAPRFLAPLAKSLERLPELQSVIGLIEGAGETGAAMISQVDMICFTGSVETGRIVGEACARAFIPAALELGGKDPAIVLADADIDRAAAGILWGGTANAGQSCLSIERVYAHSSIYDEFVVALANKARALKLAYPTPESGSIGPIIAEDQIHTIVRHLEDARAKGARFLSGGDLQNLGGGTYLAPTIIADVDHTMLIMTEETFGPILPVMKFETEAEAIHLANDTIYGLSGSVWGQEDRANGIGRQIDAGAISINDAALTAVMHEGEKQAFKFSGIGGSRMGTASIRRFYRRQSLLVNRSIQPDPWWWPSE